MTDTLANDIAESVARALHEDIGTGDLTAELIDADAVATADIVVRETAVLCGTPWFDEVFRQVDRGVRIDWLARDGYRCSPDTRICSLHGNARALLTGERTAINYLQTLSGTATLTAEYCAAVAGTGAKILDTRKTLPGLRLAQKHAVRCGGGTNHRIGLFDAILIKENHIVAAGSIGNAVARAQALNRNVSIEVEVETMAELREALETSAERLLLDDFSLPMLREAVAIRNAHRNSDKLLEASGGVRLDSVVEIAATGVDLISVGSLTKNVQAIDFSMRMR
jgi:nicotinate-nucleotide pyrophosphorylase (carboxylating)